MAAPFFDTNIIIDWLKRNAGAIAELKRYEDVRISRIVWTEIVAGVAMNARGDLLNALAQFEIVDLDQEIAEAAAEIRFRSRLKLIDAFILATAQVNHAILVTRNTKDFPADMPGIRIPYTI